MFVSIKIWRIWHRKVNIRQKRYATASAIAASAILQLVQSRSHRVHTIQLKNPLTNKIALDDLNPHAAI